VNLQQHLKLATRGELAETVEKTFPAETTATIAHVEAPSAALICTCLHTLAAFMLDPILIRVPQSEVR
jgi:hypothetical protein